MKFKGSIEGGARTRTEDNRHIITSETKLGSRIKFDKQKLQNLLRGKSVVDSVKEISRLVDTSLSRGIVKTMQFHIFKYIYFKSA